MWEICIDISIRYINVYDKLIFLHLHVFLLATDGYKCVIIVKIKGQQIGSLVINNEWKIHALHIVSICSKYYIDICKTSFCIKCLKQLYQNKCVRIQRSKKTFKSYLKQNYIGLDQTESHKTKSTTQNFIRFIISFNCLMK